MLRPGKSNRTRRRWASSAPAESWTEPPCSAEDGCRAFLPWERSGQQGRTGPAPPRSGCGCRPPSMRPSPGPTYRATYPWHVWNGDGEVDLQVPLPRKLIRNGDDHCRPSVFLSPSTRATATSFSLLRGEGRWSKGMSPRGLEGGPPAPREGVQAPEYKQCGAVLGGRQTQVARVHVGQIAGAQEVEREAP